MDLSQQFIDMCAKAIQLQATKQQHDFGDFVFHDGVVKVVNNYHLGEGGNEYGVVWAIDHNICTQWFMEDFLQPVWLPRQDQLLEILFKTSAAQNNDWTKVTLRIVYDRAGKIIEVCDDEGDIDASFEQYYLKGVMYFAFNKLWDADACTWVDKK